MTKKLSGQLMKVGLAVGAGIAAYKGKPVVVNAKFMGPIRAALGTKGFVYNVQVDTGPAMYFGEGTFNVGDCRINGHAGSVVGSGGDG